MKKYMVIFWFEAFHIKLIGSKPLRILFDKIDRFVRVYDGTTYLVLSGGEKYFFIYNSFRYLIRVKHGIT